MKKLLIALMFVCGSASAEQWFEMPNKAGGRIILLLEKCADNDAARMVITTSPTGANTTGCWFYFADTITIAWKSGEISSFDKTAFAFKGTK